MDTAGSALGRTLHAWRDRLAPRDVGLSNAGRRRAQGLRREELAALAGLSVDYLVRLEQSRANTPSAQVVESLARALQLNIAERDHLYQLSGLRTPAIGTISTYIPPGVQRLVAGLRDTPIAVFTADWSLLTWNNLWVSLVGDPLQVPLAERNLVYAMFLDPQGRSRWPVQSEQNEHEVLSAIVSDLRVAAANYPGDKKLAALIDTAKTGSATFSELWDSAHIGNHVSDRKTITHALVGKITLDCDTLLVPGVDLKVVAYTARAGSSDAEKLDLIRVSAIHAFVPTS